MNAVPTSIGIILDGNRRWAKAQGLSTLKGHRRGFEKLKEATQWVGNRGIKHLVVYGFSTENWNRGAEEVSYLMDLIRRAAEEMGSELGTQGVRVQIIGQKERFDPSMREVFSRIEAKTASNTALTLWVCLSYGSRAEIVHAAQELQKSDEAVTEESLSKHLWTAEMPDPDLIIRPGGEKRLSNFLLWQAAYSELFFLDKLWPDFSEADLDAVLAEYVTRERRRGK